MQTGGRASRLVPIVSVITARPLAATGAATLIGAGILTAIMGSAAGALVLAAGIGVSGFIDRRLPVLASVALLPTLTVFHPLVLGYVGGSALDFRLLLTGGIGLAIAPWFLAEIRRPDLVGWLLLSFVAILAVLSLGNSVSPLHALPVLGRWATYAIVYLAARTWLADRNGTWLVIGAIVIGMVIPAVSGLIQTVAGEALQINDAARLSGIYATSPVGLGLAMQLAGLALAGVVALRDRPRDRAQKLVVVLLILFTIVLVGTATRLVFASFVVGLLLTAALARHYRAMPFIVLGAAVVLITQPGLAGRYVSTIEPMPTIPPADMPGVSPPLIDPDKVVIGDASLRFRLYVWGSMVPEWWQSPLLGRGTGSFATIFEARSGLQRVAPHNDYLGVAVETGIVGLASYLLLQLAIVVTLARRILARRPARPRVDELVTLVGFVTLDIVNAINNPMLFLDLQVVMWALLGSSLGRSSSEADEPSGSAVAAVDRSVPARVVRDSLETR